MKFKSALITDASGSIGGLTASRNRGGPYLRARVVPVNPNTPFQQAIRGFVAGLTSRWGNILTPAEREAWDVYALNVPLPDTLGDPRNVGGMAMFIRSNVPRLQAALPRTDAAPVVFDLGSFTNPSFGTFAGASDDFAVTFDDTDLWANEDDSAMLIYSSRPQNPSINFFKGPYRFAGMIDGDGVTAPTSPATIAASFVFAAGQKIFVQIRITRADGRLTLPFRGGGVAA